MSTIEAVAREIRILIVCANNICRSPIAEAVFRDAARREGLHEVVVDSAGIFASDAGERPDPRAVEEASGRGYDLSRIRARQVTTADFVRFQWILAMDESNLRALASVSPKPYSGDHGLLMDFAVGDRKFARYPIPASERERSSTKSFVPWNRPARRSHRVLRAPDLIAAAGRVTALQ